MTEKTNIDDIIGIVKTEEKTDSVELKKEYYKSQMTEKRYENMDLDILDGFIRRSDNVCLYVSTEIVSELNRLFDENEQLKLQLKEKDRMISFRDKMIRDVNKAINGDFDD